VVICGGLWSAVVCGVQADPSSPVCPRYGLKAGMPENHRTPQVIAGRRKTAQTTAERERPLRNVENVAQ